MTQRSPLSYLPLFAAIFAITPLAIDMYLPAMPGMTDDFSTGISQVQMSLSIFLAGYALGMLTFGPMADHFGRKFFLIAGLSGFILTSLALAFAPSIEWFITLRLLQAIFGGAATVVVPGTIRDLFGKDTAKGMAYVSMAMMIAPMLAPTIGSLILSFTDWPKIFIVLSVYGFVILMIAMAKFPFLPPKPKQDHRLLHSIVKSYRIVFSNRHCYPFLLTTMVTTFSFFTYITSVSFVYISVYELSEQTFGILFGSNVVALMCGNFINARLVSRIGTLKMLRIALINAVFSAACLLYVVASGASVVWLVTALLFLMANLIMVSTNSDALVLLSFPNNSGTATAVIGSLKFGSGAFAGLALSLLHDGTALPFALIVATSVAITAVVQSLVKWRRIPVPGQTSA
ncbi:multidrug effflux MFS transporter [Pleionea mediterranea]|uniref:Bcr/CflA family efflux transporter n=1 Tax=Pleionea mediterranea TaxID=523701 RepID=A0A316FZW7_9GAMM|nr:multidrug effflux MFS transporter [Pleionea mediterranea]PWK53090.1 DHA1 family bicyclomycin/chloramphenicol resistance-like MFS transporter [Pleionea mediterranea]